MAVVVAFAVWLPSPSVALSYNFGPTVTQTGPEETVFDWTTMRCEEWDIPDSSSRAFWDAQGRTQLISTHFPGRRMIGSNLDQVSKECNAILPSHENPDPAAFDYKEWLTSVWTSDGQTIHALVHNEFQGHRLGASVCPSMDYTKCWYNSITLATSTDQGASYTHTSPPSHRVATVPYQYVADTGPYGVFEPSNTIYTQRPGDSQPYYYAMVRVEDYPKGSPVQQNGACVMRTQNLSDPTSWRAWNGTSFSVRFIDPYLEPGADPSQHVCKPVSRPQIVKMSYNVTYSNHFGKYLLVAPAGKIDPTSGAAVWGFYYSTSTDLVNWSTRELLMEAALPWSCPTGNENQVHYPALLDPTGTSRNFETTGKRAYLYFTRFNYPCSVIAGPDRDQIRIPIEFTGSSAAPAEPTLSDTDPGSPANDNTPEVKGTAAAGTTVRLYEAATASDCNPETLAATGSAAAFASSGLTVSVADDSTTTLRATATDGAGNASGCSASSISYTEDSTAAEPTLTDTDPDSPANDNSPEVKGTAEPGSTVRLYRTPDCSGAAAATGTAADFASPGFTVSVPADSTTTFRATVTDAVGNASGCSTSSIVYVEDSTAPGTPTLTATDPASPANNNSPKVKGTADTGSTVRLYKAPTAADCTPANLVATGLAAAFASSGLTVSVLDNSNTKFRATASDAGGTSGCSASAVVYVEDSIAPGRPTLTATDPASPANNNSPKVKGTAAANSTVRLYRAPSATNCTPANLAATGTAATFASPGITVSVPDNSNTKFRATATDAAGNTSPCSASAVVYVEDSIAPGRPTLTASDPASPANNNSPEVIGTAAANTTVTLYKAATTADCTPPNLAATGTAAAFASPGLTVSVPDNSSTRFRATATDAASNTSACSTSSIVYVEDSTLAITGAPSPTSF